MKNSMTLMGMVLGFGSLLATHAYAESKKHHNLEVLGQLRSANAIYFGEHDGVYPQSLMDLVHAGLIKQIPTLQTGGRRAWRVTNYKADICKPGATPRERTIAKERIKDTGGWGYIMDPSSEQCHGIIFIDSVESDPDGNP